MLCYTMLYYVIVHYTILYYTCYTLVCYVMPCYGILYTILCYTELYYLMLYCTVLYYPDQIIETTKLQKQGGAHLSHRQYIYIYVEIQNGAHGHLPIETTSTLKKMGMAYVSSVCI